MADLAAEHDLACLPCAITLCLPGAVLRGTVALGSAWEWARLSVLRKGPGMAVEIGEQAPDFELADQHGTTVRLSDFRGSKNIVLIFYPLAFSPVCSAELYALRDEFPEVSREDVELLTVSVDSMFTHRAWADTEHFNFGLLSDFWPHGGVAKTYGVFDDARGLATRGSFIIDKAGVVRWKVMNPIPRARDISDYQKALAELR
jgi:mycoredoxin-dependent peroxiredoxin